MLILSKFSYGLGVGAVVLAVLLSAIGSVTAQEQSPGSGLRISPTRSEIVLSGGEQQNVVQTVRNVTNGPVTVTPILNDFESDNVSGEPKLVGNQDEVSANSLREFISLPEAFDLQPEEEREVTVSLSVPEDAAPGGYFGSVLYRATPVGASGGGQVALVASVGSLVLVEVPGNIIEKIEISHVKAYIGDSKGSFFTKKPDGIGALINNLGNSFSKPFGKVSVRDWRNKEVFQYDMNGQEPKANVLPSSSRLFLEPLVNVEEKTVNGVQQKDETSPITMPGRYTITANLSHGLTGEVYTVKSTFWYIPTWLIITIVVLLLALVAGSYYMFRKYKTKKTRR